MFLGKEYRIFCKFLGSLVLIVSNCCLVLGFLLKDVLGFIYIEELVDILFVDLKFFKLEVELYRFILLLFLLGCLEVGVYFFWDR